MSALSVMVMVMDGESCGVSAGVCGSDGVEGVGEGGAAAALRPRLSDMPAKPFGRWVLGFMQKADSSSL